MTSLGKTRMCKYEIITDVLGKLVRGGELLKWVKPSEMGLKKDLLLVLTIESVVLGVVLGFVIRPFNP
ncbi:hypothetical protein TELCIR_15063, partial [Teladorsagia circumcincta]